MVDSFRTTGFLEKHTSQQEHHEEIKAVISGNKKAWDFIIDCHEEIRRKTHKD